MPHCCFYDAGLWIIDIERWKGAVITKDQVGEDTIGRKDQLIRFLDRLRVGKRNLQ